MHLLIPHASVLSPGAFDALRHAALPSLAGLFERLTQSPVAALAGADEYRLSAPHERVLAGALGWQGDDGALPWAARAARDDGIDVGGGAVGLVTPAHWLLGSDSVSLLDPASLALDETEARRLHAVASEAFDAAGFLLRYGAPNRWYAEHPSLAGLPCASLDRVIGRNVDVWLTADPRLRPLRRLQSEVQMLWHRHPVNDAREARGAPVVNSFWLSGCGVAQAERVDVAPPVVDDRLRAPALAQDWPAWVAAWRALDKGPLNEALVAVRNGDATTVSLCGERSAVRLHGPATGRLARWFGPRGAATALAALEAL